MAKQVINIGTTANDGTGDPIRDAFDKCNDNFTELYTDDAGDVGSITATAPIERDSATGAVTISLADNGIDATKLNVGGNGSVGQALISDGDGSFSWTDLEVGDITSVVAGNGLTGGGTTGDVTLTLGVDDSTIEINSDAARVKDLGVTNAKIANDAISYEKIDAEFSTSSALSAAATVNVDFDAAQVFTLTPNQATTLNITNPKIGLTKCAILTGAGGSYTLAFTVGGASGTFNKIAGDYDDTSSTKNFLQIVCVSATEFWYSISQIAS